MRHGWSAYLLSSRHRCRGPGQRGYIRVAVSQNPPAWSMNTALGKSTKFTLTRGSIRYITHDIINVRLDGNLLQHQREPLIYASVATAQTLKTPLRRLVLLYGEANRRQIFCREQSSSGENLPSSARGQSLESLKGNPWPWARAGALFRNQNSRE